MSVRFLDDFFSLFYPRLCLSCGKNVPAIHEILCVSCQYHLPKTNFHLDKENPFTERFWGRLDLYSAAALYHFTKGGRTQKLIHHLKYQGKKQVGIKLGQLYGKALKTSPYFEGIDLIVPVPLHPRKEKTRGYNQSDLFAQGLSEGMEKAWSSKGLSRVEMTATQTQKTRLERLENVSQAFVVPDPSLLQGKHILLVDDVITTGATLECCALQILEIPDAKISLATIAFASDM